MTGPPQPTGPSQRHHPTMRGLVADDIVGADGGVMYPAPHPTARPRPWDGDDAVLRLAAAVAGEIAAT